MAKEHLNMTCSAGTESGNEKVLVFMLTTLAIAQFTKNNIFIGPILYASVEVK